MTRPIRLGARTSPLARAQASRWPPRWRRGGIETTFVGVTTAGDLDQRQLTEIGGTGVFVSAVRDALRRGEIDVAVHSLKDLPTAPAEDLEIIAIPAREDTRDVLVGRRLDDLSDGARVGTGAPRRAMQMIDWAAAGTSGWRSCRFGATSTPGSSWSGGEGRRGDLGRGRVAPARPAAGDGSGSPTTSLSSSSQHRSLIIR